ncbi:MAG: hypothetical protein OCC49_07520 [Fibrobacterales bacterium]
MKNDFDRLPGRPFTYKEIEQYVADEANESLSNAIVEYTSKYPQFKKELDEWSALRNPIPFSDIASYIEKESGREEAPIRQSARSSLFSGFAQGLSRLLNPQVQGIVATCVVVAVVVGVVTMQNGPDRAMTVMAKGQESIALTLNKNAVDAAQPIPVSKGDRIGFTYRAVEDFYFMVLYQDDSKSIEPYVIEGEQALKVSFSIKEKMFNGSVTLNDDFQTELVWIVTSAQSFDLKTARRSLAQTDQSDDIDVKQYQLIQAINK